MTTRDTTTQAVLKAYDKLPPAQRRKIDELAKTLEDGISRRKPSVKGFGKQSALEVLGKLGLLIAAHDPAPQPAHLAPAARPTGKRSTAQRPRRRARHV
jgi:hypothetical protein